MAAFGRFKHELKNLEHLYIGTRFSYTYTIDSAVESVVRSLQDPTQSLIQRLYPDRTIENAEACARSFENRLESEYPQHLREIIFVRIISVLEVFLIETLREIFMARKDLFQRDDRIELSYGQLLSFNSAADIATHLINKESRFLQNAGFKKTSAYFNKHFGLNFRQISPVFDKICEYHDRRHLLVHRLGHSDAKYRHDYNTVSKRLSIDHKYLLECFDNVHSFCSALTSEVKQIVYSAHVEDSAIEPTCVCRISINILAPQGHAVMNRNHRFAYQDDILLLGNLLHKQYQDDDNNIILELRGSTSHVDAYLKHVKTFKKNGYIDLKDVEFSRRIGKKSRIPNDFLESIEDMVVGKPQSPDTYKQLSNKLGITYKQAKHIMKCANLDLPPDLIDKIKGLIATYPESRELHKKIATEVNLPNWKVYHVVRKLRQCQTWDTPAENKRQF